VILTLVCGRARWRRAAFAAFLMNATSFGTGVLMSV